MFANIFLLSISLYLLYLPILYIDIYKKYLNHITWARRNFICIYIFSQYITHTINKQLIFIFSQLRYLRSLDPHGVHNDGLDVSPIHKSPSPFAHFAIRLSMGNCYCTARSTFQYHHVSYWIPIQSTPHLVHYQHVADAIDKCAHLRDTRTISIIAEA